MAEGNKIRLIKIASEINIGRETIVEYLKTKGYDIDNKPTATLSEDMIEIVYDKFKREKKAAEKQREKILKHKEIRKQVDPKSQHHDEHEYAEGNLEETLMAKHIEDEIKDNEPIAKSEVPAAVEEKPAFEEKPIVEIQAVEEKPAPMPEAVIDIKPTEAKAEVESKPAIEAVQKVEATPIAEKTVELLEEKPRATSADAKVEQPARKQEQRPQQHQQQQHKAPQRQEHQQGQGQRRDFDPSRPKDQQRPAEEGDPRRDVRKKKKKKKIIEVVEQGQTPKLSGLKILGKIDIPREKQQQQDNNRFRDKKKVKPKPVDEELLLDADLDKKLKKKPKSKDTVVEFGEDKPAKFKGKVDEKKRKKRKKSIRESITQEEVLKAIRETYAGMEFHGSSNRAKIKQKKKTEREEKEIRQLEERERDSKILKLTEFVTTSDLANLMNKPANEIILKCMSLGLMVTINQRLDKDTIILIADDYGYEVEFIDQQKVSLVEEDDSVDENLLPRPPIVTIMGHVDHGKTSLLDYIRHSNVVAGEAGGITQHIGAYKVTVQSGKSITFLDTPGHEAFTAMRARGAQVTDIVVLVVAADDSVMPQTIEAISHAKAANVPMVVAINKIDKPDANPDRIKQQLSDYGVLIEEWGGKYQHVEISAKKGINVDLLLEKILLEADLLSLKANPDRNARGVVIESNVSKGLGSVATVVVQKGTLVVGDCFVSGVHFGKVRAMQDERGNKMESAPPAVPVRVIGFDGLPEAGDTFFVVENEVEARNISTERKKLKREQELRQVRHLTLDEISSQIKIGGVQDLNLIIKGDVGGSVEAISDSLLKLSTNEVRVNILHSGVGTISESDIMLAAASQAIVIGFNVSPSTAARRIADNENIEVRLYSIIYDCINEVQLALEGLLKPDIKEEITSEVEVRRIFKISRLGSIAGCYVLSGKIIRNDKVKLLRDGLPIFHGGISSLKRGKDDVREVDTSYECGIQLDGYNDLQEGDIIQGYKLVEVRRSL